MHNAPALTRPAALAAARSLWAAADRLTLAGEHKRAAHAVELARTREAEARRLPGELPCTPILRMVTAGALRSPLR